MKSILQSIKPQYCELIAAGKKTYEVRKTRPKIETPFKVYIYMTAEKRLAIFIKKDDYCGIGPDGEPAYADSNCPVRRYNPRSQKVIGEYVCDEIKEYETEFYSSNDFFQGIWSTIYDEDIDDTIDFIETSNELDNPNDCEICEKSCLTFDEIKNYVGHGDKKFYAWHISNLVIYDKPKELSEFNHYCGDEPDCSNCPYLYVESNEDVGTYEKCQSKEEGWKPLTRPPQSWCYCEEV